MVCVCVCGSVHRHTHTHTTMQLIVSKCASNRSSVHGQFIFWDVCGVRQGNILLNIHGVVVYYFCTYSHTIQDAVSAARARSMRIIWVINLIVAAVFEICVFARAAKLPQSWDGAGYIFAERRVALHMVAKPPPDPLITHYILVYAIVYNIVHARNLGRLAALNCCKSFGGTVLRSNLATQNLWATSGLVGHMFIFNRHIIFSYIHTCKTLNNLLLKSKSFAGDPHAIFICAPVIRHPHMDHMMRAFSHAGRPTCLRSCTGYGLYWGAVM